MHFTYRSLTWSKLFLDKGYLDRICFSWSHCYIACKNYRCAKYCPEISIPTKPLYAFSSRDVTGPGISPSPISDPFIECTGQIQKLVEVTNDSSAV